MGELGGERRERRGCGLLTALAMTEVDQSTECAMVRVGGAESSDESEEAFEGEEGREGGSGSEAGDPSNALQIHSSRGLSKTALHPLLEASVQLHLAGLSPSPPCADHIAHSLQQIVADAICV